jgi:heme exporter protein A
MPSVVEIEKVTKNFGYIRALRGIDLNIDECEKVSLLGPNGAGKSTLLRLIAIQMVPSSGSVRVLNLDSKTSREEIKKMIGVVGHRSFLYDELTVMENLKFYGSFIACSNADYEYSLKIASLEKWRNVKTGHLSYGLRKRGDIARALLGEPKLLLLDEFFSGLDSDTSNQLLEHLNKLENKTIIVSSHSPELVHRLCDRSIHLRDGLIERDEAIK